MPVQVPDDVFLAFLEAAAFENEQLGLDAAIASVDVARTAGLDLATVRGCVERLVTEGLGYVPQDHPEGIHIDAKRVGFAIRKHQRAAANRPADPAGSTYNLQITGSTIASLATGEHARAVGAIQLPTAGSSPSQGSGAPPAAYARAVLGRMASQDSGSPKETNPSPGPSSANWDLIDLFGDVDLSRKVGTLFGAGALVVSLARLPNQAREPTSPLFWFAVLSAAMNITLAHNGTPDGKALLNSGAKVGRMGLGLIAFASFFVMALRTVWCWEIQPGDSQHQIVLRILRLFAGMDGVMAVPWLFTRRRFRYESGYYDPTAPAARCLIRYFQKPHYIRTAVSVGWTVIILILSSERLASDGVACFAVAFGIMVHECVMSLWRRVRDPLVDSKPGETPGPG